MANLFNETVNGNLTTALGGSITAGDSVYLSEEGTQYTTLDLSGTDLALFEVGRQYRLSLDGLKLTLNRTATGILRYLGAHPGSWGVSSTGASGVIHEIDYFPAAGGNIMRLSSMNNEVLYAGGGAVVADGSADCDTVRFGGSASGHFLDHASANLTLCEAFRQSTVLMQRTCATLRAYGASTIALDKPAATWTAAQTYGGTLRVLQRGTITTLTAPAGVVDLRSLSGPLTITNCTLGDRGDLAWLWPDNRDLITFSNTPTLLGRDPRDN